MVDLQAVKDRIKVVSGNEKLNNKIMRDMQNADDCFGRQYEETNEECVICQIISELDGRRAPLSTFCKEISQQVDEPAPPEVEQEEAVIEEKVLSKLREEEPVKPKKIQKTKLDFGPGGAEAFINKSIEEGMPDKDIKKALYDKYREAGRDEKYSKIKAGFWLSYTKGRRKKGVFVTG